jgi:hypothetical protein
MKSIIFWDMAPYSPLSFNLRFGGIYRLHLQGRRNKFSKNQQASRWQAECLKMEAICSSKMVETQRATQRHIPENDTLVKVMFSRYLINYFSTLIPLYVKSDYQKWWWCSPGILTTSN